MLPPSAVRGGGFFPFVFAFAFAFGGFVLAAVVLVSSFPLAVTISFVLALGVAAPGCGFSCFVFCFLHGRVAFLAPLVQAVFSSLVKASWLLGSHGEGFLAPWQRTSWIPW